MDLAELSYVGQDNRHCKLWRPSGSPWLRWTHCIAVQFGKARSERDESGPMPGLALEHERYGGARVRPLTEIHHGVRQNLRLMRYSLAS